MDSKRLRDLREAYGAIYEPELELAEEQIWEEVENWVSSLLEEGYDLSEYTWEELYEEYLTEIGFNPAAGKPAKGEVVNLPKVKGAITGGNVTLNRGYASTLGGQKGEVTYQKKGNVVTRNFRPTGMSDIRGSKTPGSNTPATTPAPKPAITPATTPAARGSGGAPRPSIAAPAKASPTPTKPTATAQTGDKAKDMATFAKANPALAAASAERARTRGTSATTNPLMRDMKSRMPAPSTPSPTTTSTALSKSTPSLSKPMSSSSNYSSAKVSPSANVIGKKDQKPLASSFEWGSTSKLVEGIADAYSSIYEAKKVDQDKDGDNDFADVRIARLIASGVSKEEAIRRVKDKSYNEETELGEETLQDKKDREEKIAARRARVRELTQAGRTMTSAMRTKGAAAQRKEEKRAEALERAANAILRQTTGSSGRVSDKPMGSVAPAPKEEAPEANRRLKTGLRRDTLGTAADDALKGVKKEDYEIYEAILDYLLDHNFAETQDNADVIIENMSEEWAYEILEGYKKLPVAKMIKQASRKSVRAGLKAGNLGYTHRLDDVSMINKADKQVAKMARVASRHSTIKGKAKVRGEGQALLNKIRGEK